MKRRSAANTRPSQLVAFSARRLVFLRFEYPHRSNTSPSLSRRSLFFASIMPFMEKFTVRDDPDNVHIHFDNCDIYDWSAIEAVNR